MLCRNTILEPHHAYTLGFYPALRWGMSKALGFFWKETILEPRFGFNLKDKGVCLILRVFYTSIYRSICVSISIDRSIHRSIDLSIYLNIPGKSHKNSHDLRSSGGRISAGRLRSGHLGRLFGAEAQGDGDLLRWNERGDVWLDREGSTPWRQTWEVSQIWEIFENWRAIMGSSRSWIKGSARDFMGEFGWIQMNLATWNGSKTMWYHGISWVDNGWFAGLFFGT